ncbi:hypothetical protein GL263_08850 [Streptomyces durbertensis]|uniref:Uncharacterized protein n=1 Tax=Streptomyces durbertensis TaxID=2448886 RepID=A0ABR6EE99_9ACTN|nr:hypothetical protein [Streptomyces durbertensis]MBB1243665.1 hypothetical protein [Streptomyces durbertensis]
MRIRPDAAAAARDQYAVEALVRVTLRRALPDSVPVPTVDSGALRDPRVVALAHAVARGEGPGPGCAAALLATAAAQAPEHRWPAFAAPAPHLRQCLRRALAAGPPGVGRSERPTALVDWRPEDQVRVTAAIRLLDRRWVRMLDELRSVTVALALVDGPGVEGHTDFRVHGAVLLNRRRLHDSPRGLPGTVSCAEALVHEGTRSRCNAAAVSAPFLLPAAGDRATDAPLHADPRPLDVLFQQLVALVRCAQFYRRMLDAAAAPNAADADAVPPAVRDRYGSLRHQAVQLAAALETQRTRLTGVGAAVLDETHAALAAPPHGPVVRR